VSRAQSESIKLIARSTAEAHKIVAAAEAEAKRVVSEAEQKRLLAGIDDEASALDKLMAILSWPYEFAYKWTMPDCHMESPDEEEMDALRKEIEECQDEEARHSLALRLKEIEEPILSCGQKYYMVTFLGALVWIMLLSYFMVEFVLKLGCLWGISPTIMGLTLLAMGTSIPDALSSIVVAKNGEGDMAVANAVGSNVFNIGLGLGLPWFIKTLVDGKPLCINDADQVVPSIMILLFIVLILFAILFQQKWQLKPCTGYVLIGIYGLFVVYQLIQTMMPKSSEGTCNVC